MALVNKKTGNGIPFRFVKKSTGKGNPMVPVENKKKKERRNILFHQLKIFKAFKNDVRSV